AAPGRTAPGPASRPPHRPLSGGAAARPRPHGTARAPPVGSAKAPEYGILGARQCLLVTVRGERDAGPHTGTRGDGPAGGRRAGRPEHGPGGARGGGPRQDRTPRSPGGPRTRLPDRARRRQRGRDGTPLRRTAPALRPAPRRPGPPRRPPVRGTGRRLRPRQGTAAGRVPARPGDPEPARRGGAGETADLPGGRRAVVRPCLRAGPRLRRTPVAG